MTEAQGPDGKTAGEVDEIVHMPIAEFRAAGYLQEVNRQLLHPLGLALEVLRDTETGEETLGGVWDYRDDPEGINYGEMTPDDVTRAQRIAAELEERAPARRAALGYVIQPLQ